MRDAEQQKYSEIAALVSVTVGRVQFGNAEPRFYTAWVKTGKAQCEQIESALPQIADSTRTSRHVREVPTRDIEGPRGSPQIDPIAPEGP